MSETKHRPAPWWVDEDAATWPGGAVVRDAVGLRLCEMAAVDARRIVAAVNACAGLPTEELERLGTGGVIRALNGLAVIDAAALLRALAGKDGPDGR